MPKQSRRLAVAGIAAIAVVVLIAGGWVLITHLGAQRPGGPHPVPTTIESGFLLYEAEAAQHPVNTQGQGWTRGEAVHTWPLKMCVGDPKTTEAVQARRLEFHSTSSKMIEQLSVFGSVAAAQRAMSLVRTETQRCAQFADAGVTVTRTVAPLSVGDEAILVKTVITYAPGPAEGPRTDTLWDVFVRRGNAIIWYSGTDRAQVERDAAAMVTKMCRYAAAC
jgi:hypothetical protein